MLRVPRTGRRSRRDIESAGFRDTLLMGMGGSSLCPEVLAKTFKIDDVLFPDPGNAFFFDRFLIFGAVSLLQLFGQGEGHQIGHDGNLPHE